MKSVHFAGIGGIGMSALAAGAAACGWEVSGSDRGAEQPENAPLIGALKAQGIAIYPQDGSRFASGEELPDLLVYSTAVESDNPDLLAAKEIRQMHRSEFLRLLLDEFNKISIAVSGSCGKSSVTACITEVLERLGGDPLMINGALSKRYRRADNAGNFRSGNGRFLVFEADESDKSLLSYGADYALVLNIGTDHYDREELARVFGEFLRNIRRGAVLSRQVAEALDYRFPAGLEVRIFDDAGGASAPEYALAEYLPGEKSKAVFGDGKSVDLPVPGKHAALNALAIRALTRMLGFEDAAVLDALKYFDGVWRRNDFAGTTPQGAMVFDDYAHNPEKIISCLTGMREKCNGENGRLIAVFQPHGYKPFGFMEQALFELLENFLQPEDRFILLEPFYAGGTSSFSPHSADVCVSWQGKSALPERFLCLPDREAVKEFVSGNTTPGDVVVIMGARDNSLSMFASSLTL